MHLHTIIFWLPSRRHLLWFTGWSEQLGTWFFGFYTSWSTINCPVEVWSDNFKGRYSQGQFHFPLTGASHLQPMYKTEDRMGCKLRLGQTGPRANGGPGRLAQGKLAPGNTNARQISTPPNSNLQNFNLFLWSYLRAEIQINKVWKPNWNLKSWTF